MKVGESASVIRHTVILTSGKSIEIFQNNDDTQASIETWREHIKTHPSFSLVDIHGETHRFFTNTMSYHGMKMVKVTMKAADPNPLNQNYGEDEVS